MTIHHVLKGVVISENKKYKQRSKEKRRVSPNPKCPIPPFYAQNRHQHIKIMSFLNLVAGVDDLVAADKVLLDGTHADEAGQQVSTAGLVIGTASSGTTEGLLADNSAGGLDVDVEVTGGVAESLLGEADGVAVLSKDCTGQGVVGRSVNVLANLGEGVRGGIVVDVDAEDGAEELLLEKRVCGVLGCVDGRVDVVALGTVVLAADQQLELRVVLGLIDDLAELVETALVDDGADEVGVVLGVANLQLLGLGDQTSLDAAPQRGREVCARGGRALLALVLEGTADGVDDGVFDVGRGVDKMEVLATSLTDDARVALVAALSDTVGNLAVQTAEDGGGTSEVESSELTVGKDNLGHLSSITGKELNDTLGKASLEKDLVKEVVGGHGRRRRLPDDNVTHQGRGAGQVTTDGGEVEGGNGVDETLERTVLDTVPDTGGVVCGLVSVCVLSVLDIKAEEVAELGSSIDLSLVCVLALAGHGGSHNLIAVLASDQVGGLEEDGSAVGKGKVLPCGLCGQSSIDGC